MLVNDPWPYMVLDDYVDQPVMDGVLRVAQQKIKDGLHGAWRLEEELPELYKDWEKKIKKDFFEFYSQFPKRRFILKPKVLSHIVVLPPGYYEGPHFDRFQKIFTSVTYVHPSKSTGTYIHESEDYSIFKEIEWKPNRSLLFCGVTNLTWHSFKNDTDEPRITFANMLTDEYIFGAYNFYRKYILRNEDRLCRPQ